MRCQKRKANVSHVAEGLTLPQTKALELKMCPEFGVILVTKRRTQLVYLPKWKEGNPGNGIPEP